MSAEIQAIGNEGFRITADDTCILIDAFYHSAPWVGSAPFLRGNGITAGDLILITHAHADHFNEPDVLDVATRTGAVIVGPPSVIDRFHGHLPGRQLLTMAPPVAAENQPAPSRTAQRPPVRITAFRTFHGKEHLSYLVETPSFRFFHDGDNEDTRRLDASALGTLDALFIAPWQGSGWVDFIDTLKPARWFMMHLTREELDQQAKGEFLPDLCDHVPANLVTLSPGQSYLMP